MKSPKIQNHSLSNWFGLYKEVDSITVWAIGDSVLQMSKNYTRVIDIFLAGLNHIKGITIWKPIWIILMILRRRLLIILVMI